MSGPDIESLIAAAKERHAPINVRLSDGTYDDDDRECVYDLEDWPCPDRLLLDALVPVYEAAKRIDAAEQAALDAILDLPTEGAAGDDSDYPGAPLVSKTRVFQALDPLSEAIQRAALGEPNA